jgi:hypothetical protein
MLLRNEKATAEASSSTTKLRSCASRIVRAGVGPAHQKRVESPLQSCACFRLRQAVPAALECDEDPLGRDSLERDVGTAPHPLPVRGCCGTRNQLDERTENVRLHDDADDLPVVEDKSSLAAGSCKETPQIRRAGVG